jgi:hypothetical protein
MARADVLSEEHFVVLNSLVLKKMATIGAVVQATGMRADDVVAIFRQLEADGSVASTGAHLFPTEEGTERAKQYAQARYAGNALDPALERWAARYDGVNRRFVETITSWETVEVGSQQTANDHSDPDYDARVISRIDALVVRGGKLIDEVSQQEPRLRRYAERLEEAFGRVDEGDTRYISDLLLDSVRTVWFELHEDVLQVLGRPRTELGAE